VSAPAVIPHNLDMERALLGALLRRSDLIAEVRDVVTPEDFWRSGHATLYRRMLQVAAAGSVIDLVTLAPLLERHQEMEEVGGLAYVSRLSDDAPRAANAAHYAEGVKGYAVRRECLRVAAQLAADAQEADDVTQATAAAEAALRALQSGRADTSKSAEEAVEGALALLERYQSADESGVTGVPSGLPNLDRMLGGWQPGSLNIIAARPSVGKTAFMGQVCAYAAVRRQVPTLVVTLEQDADALALRMASNRARVNADGARRHALGDADLLRLNDACREIRAAPLRFQPARGWRMSDIRRVARQWHARGACELLAIDYLGLVAPEVERSKGETRERQVALQTALARDIATELRIPALLLCQLSREYEKDQPKGTTRQKPEPRKPRLSDLRESGAIEQDADVVLFVHRPYVRPNDEEERIREGQTELLVRKNRNGAFGDIQARFHGAWLRFEETTA
jgi:replicative DNA helicase